MSSDHLHWLHVSDLHVQSGMAGAWRPPGAALLSAISKDRLRSPWRFVFFTGDLSNSGQDADFRRLRPFLEELATATGVPRKHFYLVPGNHDLDRTEWSHDHHASARGETGAFLGALAQDPRRSAPDVPQVLAKLFASYERHLPKPVGSRGQGLFPGDFRLDVARTPITLLGLNTAFCDIDTPMRETWGARILYCQLSRLLPQPDDASTRDSIRDRLVFLLTHHPLPELRDPAPGRIDTVTLLKEFLQSARGVIHLSGHWHHPARFRIEGWPQYLSVIGPSLAGLEHKGEHIQRTHGFVSGRVSLAADDLAGSIILRYHRAHEANTWTVREDTLDELPLTLTGRLPSLSVSSNDWHTAARSYSLAIESATRSVEISCHTGKETLSRPDSPVRKALAKALQSKIQVTILCNDPRVVQESGLKEELGGKVKQVLAAFAKEGVRPGRVSPDLFRIRLKQHHDPVHILRIDQDFGYQGANLAGEAARLEWFGRGTEKGRLVDLFLRCAISGGKEVPPSWWPGSSVP